MFVCQRRQFFQELVENHNCKERVGGHLLGLGPSSPVEGARPLNLRVRPCCSSWQRIFCGIQRRGVVLVVIGSCLSVSELGHRQPSRCESCDNLAGHRLLQLSVSDVGSVDHCLAGSSESLFKVFL